MRRCRRSRHALLLRRLPRSRGAGCPWFPPWEGGAAPSFRVDLFRTMAETTSVRDIPRTISVVIEPDPGRQQTPTVVWDVPARLSPVAFTGGHPHGPVVVQRTCDHPVTSRRNRPMILSAIRAVTAGQSANRNGQRMSRPVAFRKPRARVRVSPRGRDTDGRADGPRSRDRPGPSADVSAGRIRGRPRCRAPGPGHGDRPLHRQRAGRDAN